MRVIELILVLLALHLTVADTLIDYGNGNLGDGLGNHVNGHDNTWRGNRNDLKGALNSVKGDDNRIEGDNNVVQGSGNVVSSSLSKEEMEELQNSMSNTFAERFKNMFGGSGLDSSSFFDISPPSKPAGMPETPQVPSSTNRRQPQQPTVPQQQSASQSSQQSSTATHQIDLSTLSMPDSARYRPSRTIPRQPRLLPRPTPLPQFQSTRDIPSYDYQPRAWHQPVYDYGPSYDYDYGYNYEPQHHRAPVVRPHFAPNSLDLLAQLSRRPDSMMVYHSYGRPSRRFSRFSDTYNIRPQNSDWIYNRWRDCPPSSARRRPFFYSSAFPS